jgi:hypothetical protein
MTFRSLELKSGVILVVLGLTLATVAPVHAADDELRIKARAISTLNITRAASDMVDIRITGFTPEQERSELISTLESKGNHALAAALNDQEATGWVAFDPRGGGGPGRDPRRTSLKYARTIDFAEDRKEIVLITNHYPGYGNDPQAADGAKLAEYPVSFILLKLHRDDDGEWTGIGRMFVGARIRYDAPNGKFVIDEFPMDPVYLKDVKVK